MSLRSNFASQVPAAPSNSFAHRDLRRLFPHRSRKPPEMVMRMRGLEPPRAFAHTDLNRARLPIPPHPRGGHCSPASRHCWPASGAQKPALRVPECDLDFRNAPIHPHPALSADHLAEREHSLGCLGKVHPIPTPDQNLQPVRVGKGRPEVDEGGPAIRASRVVDARHARLDANDLPRARPSRLPAH